MRSFQYRARDRRGRLVTGQISAENEKSAKKKISLDGLTVVNVKESWALDLLESVRVKFKRFTQKITSEDIMVFNRQMQIVYSVGIPIIRGMLMVAEQTTNPSLKKIIHEIIKDISEGSSLNEAMGKHDWVFDPVYINLIRVGEATGELQSMLDRASKMIETRSEQKAKVSSATFYPKLVLSFLGIVLLAIVYVVLPKLKSFFDGFGAELPLITRIVMGTSDAFVSHWYLVLMIGVGSVAGFKFVLAQPHLKYRYDQILLKLPILGNLLLQIELNSFCLIMEILLKSGISIVEAFEHAEKSASNGVVARDVAKCREKISKGQSLAVGLGETQTFPKLVTGLIAMGEEGGKIPQVLSQIADYYKLQIDQKLNNLSKLIEPILLFFIFGVVLVLALAVFMPMWKMSSAIKK